MGELQYAKICFALDLNESTTILLILPKSPSVEQLPSIHKNEEMGGYEHRLDMWTHRLHNIQVYLPTKSNFCTRIASVSLIPKCLNSDTKGTHGGLRHDDISTFLNGVTGKQHVRWLLHWQARTYAALPVKKNLLSDQSYCLMKKEYIFMHNVIM